MRILVTGGAGYVGSVVVEELINSGYLSKGHNIVVIDDLSTGHKETIQTSKYFGCLGNQVVALPYVFGSYKFDLVIHLAGETVVTKSVTNPKLFFKNNVANTINLLNVMLDNGCKKIIFSSSAAVYGQGIHIKENAKMSPISAYGESKLMVEQILRRYYKAYGLEYNIFRFFNVAGATEKYGEDHDPETHLIPSIMQVALGQKEYLDLFGNGVRDYVHVSDIAEAHVMAIKNWNSHRTYNIAKQMPISATSVVAMAEAITKEKILVRRQPERAGDPSVLWASNQRALLELGWEPQHTLESMIKTAWEWHKKYPNGYKNREWTRLT